MANDTTNVQIPIHSTLPMEDKVQHALLGHLINDERLFLQCHRRIQPTWFINPYHAKIYALMQKRFDAIGRPASKEELLNCGDMQAEDAQVRTKMAFFIEQALTLTMQIRWDAIKPELTEWLQSKILQETIVKSTNMWNKKQWKETARLMQTAASEYREAQFEEGHEVRFTDPEQYLSAQFSERLSALTTGLALLDEALMTDAIQRAPDGTTFSTGGMQLGDTTVLMAPSNTGKTTAMLTMVRHNIMRQKDILLMTHEGRPEDIRNKLLKGVLNCTESELHDMYKTPEKLNTLRNFAALIQRHCTYIPYNKAGMKVEDVVPIIRRAQEERKLKTGKGYDLLAVDYPAKLTTDQSRGALAMRNVIEIIYDYYVQLALEYKFHSLLAIQTNREGSKVNSGLNGSRLLMMEDVQEAWGVMTAASNVITLNRSPLAKRQNRITFYVPKSRSSETGQAIVARSNFAHGLTHSDDMGCVGYVGTSTMDQSIERYLSDVNYRNRMLPPELVR